MRILVRWWLVLLVASLSPLVAQGCRDQENITQRANGLEITGAQPSVQTFTCGVAGQLLRVDVDVRHHVSGVTTPLTVNILATDANGVPTNQVLATAQLQPGEIPTGSYAFVPVRFGQPVAVAPGLVLGLELMVPTTVARAYAWTGDAPGLYAAGTTYIRRTVGPLSFDMGFRTFVGSPAAAVGYGIGHPGTTGVPGLAASAPPRLGTTTDLQIGNSAVVPTAGALLVGTLRANVPTPFGGLLQVQILATLPLAVPVSGAIVPIAVPDLPSLCGGSITFQAVLADPGASHGIAFTPGLELLPGA